ncbi:hypothetical protein XENTR_v10014443 [Xenopus tropicalis]|uniref:Fetuin-B n=3 Tax=Xenopus tropicalis TaxID=8364 RepID=A0A6I8PVG7_XENTR|nr:fetuin-B [Xenopus tropicalis]KAE8603717.1 hypothetical protein XENTR_v10014443 [Xenopus tropicalis]|eukprot:XP_002937886.2 PREDICTED: fetuin-B [Xenopus tropicalis]
MRMILPAFLLVCTQVLSARASGGVACNDSGVEAAADLSLRQLNAIRRKGFVFALHRITDAHEEFNIENGTIYQLTLDVLETECHVLSKQLWRDCEPKKLNEAASGKCKVEFHINKPKRIAHLHSYNCAIRPGAERLLGCAGCPAPAPLDDVRFLEVAKLSLKKYNNENNFNSYFSIANITRGRIQVVAGKAYHVEFTIHESSCNKTTSPEKLDQCELLDSEDAVTGYCKSFAVAHWSTPDEKKVERVSCNVFSPENADAEPHVHDGGNHEHGHGHGKGHHGKKEDRHGKKHGHSKSKHGNKHDDKHKHGQKSSESHEEHSRNHTRSHHHNHRPRFGRPDSSSHTPVGNITYLTSEDASPFPENPSKSEHCPGEVKQFSPSPVSDAPSVQPAPIPK